MILTLRTDNPQAEVSLYDQENSRLEHYSWHADRELSNTLHRQIYVLLQKQSKNWSDISGIIFYSGPGSFTGLRIGASLANVLASELDIPIVQTSGKDWIRLGQKELISTPKSRLVIPEYGREPHVTKPKK